MAVAQPTWCVHASQVVPSRHHQTQGVDRRMGASGLAAAMVLQKKQPSVLNHLSDSEAHVASRHA